MITSWYWFWTAVFLAVAGVDFTQGGPWGIACGIIMTVLAGLEIRLWVKVRRSAKMAVDSILTGGYTRDEIDRIIMNWATSSDVTRSGDGDGRN